MITDIVTRPYRTACGGQGTEINYRDGDRAMCARLPWVLDADSFVRWLEATRRATL